MTRIFLICLVSLVYQAFSQHAYCDMTITVSNNEVSTVNDSIISQVNNRTGFDSSTCIYASMGGEFCGYSVISYGNPDHFQHETPQKHYVDDIYFTFTQNGNDVVIQANSKSEPVSVYDYDTNFCNSFNLFRNGNSCDLNFDIVISIGISSCPFHPDINNGNSNGDWSSACAFFFLRETA